jgi:hypothetical protein
MKPVVLMTENQINNVIFFQGKICDGDNVTTSAQKQTIQDFQTEVFS